MIQCSLEVALGCSSGLSQPQLRLPGEIGRRGSAGRCKRPIEIEVLPRDVGSKRVHHVVPSTIGRVGGATDLFQPNLGADRAAIQVHHAVLAAVISYREQPTVATEIIIGLGPEPERNGIVCFGHVHVHQDPIVLPIRPDGLVRSTGKPGDRARIAIADARLTVARVIRERCRARGLIEAQLQNPHRALVQILDLVRIERKPVEAQIVNVPLVVGIAHRPVERTFTVLVIVLGERPSLVRLEHTVHQQVVIPACQLPKSLVQFYEGHRVWPVTVHSIAHADVSCPPTDIHIAPHPGAVHERIVLCTPGAISFTGDLHPVNIHRGGTAGATDGEIITAVRLRACAVGIGPNPPRIHIEFKVRAIEDRQHVLPGVAFQGAAHRRHLTELAPVTESRSDLAQ